MPKMFAMCAPILPGKEAEHLEFMNEVKTRWPKEFREIRERLGLRERTFVQQTPHGAMVIVTLEGENPEAAFGELFGGDDEFTRWFVQQVKNCHGIDLTTPPAGPISNLLLDSQKMGEHVVA